MKNSNLLLCVLFLLTGMLVACSDDDKGGGGGDDSYVSATVKATEYGEWTYFDLASGTSRTLEIKGKEGAVTGIYYGSFEISVRGTSYGTQDSVKLIVSRLSDDSVAIDVCDLTLSMGGGTVEPFDLSSTAKVEKVNDKWVLTGVENECPVVNGTDSTYWSVLFNGEIGTAKDDEVRISGSLTPGGMPFPITASYEAVVDESFIYEVEGDESSFAWDLAFHKYDIRTNGGSALKTGVSNLDDICLSGLPASGFVADTDGSVYADMSGMMDGFVGYQYVKLNTILCDWVTKTATGTMPPTIYTLNQHVFVVKTAKGDYAKIKFYDTTNEKDKAVYASFNYEYPMK